MNGKPSRRHAEDLDPVRHNRSPKMLGITARAADHHAPVGLKPAPCSLEPFDGLHQITVRQLQCLAWVQEGKSASDIGGILGISSRTVEGHLQKVCLHLGVRTRFQAVLKALDLGLLTRRS